MVHGFSLRLFGRHVGRRAEDEALLRDTDAQCGRLRQIRRRVFFVESLREAEVEHLHLAGWRDLDIGGLQVAVNDAFLVRCFERFGDLMREPDGRIE